MKVSTTTILLLHLAASVFDADAYIRGLEDNRRILEDTTNAPVGKGKGKGKGKGGMRYYEETEAPTQYVTKMPKGKGKGGMKYYEDTEAPTEYEIMVPKGKGKYGKSLKKKKDKTYEKKKKSKKYKMKSMKKLKKSPKYWDTEVPTEYETMMPKGKGKKGKSKKYWQYTEVPTEYASKMPKGSKKEKSQKNMKDEDDMFTQSPQEMFTKVPKSGEEMFTRAPKGYSMTGKSKKYDYYETKVPKGKGKGGMKYYEVTEAPTEYETMMPKGKGKYGKSLKKKKDKKYKKKKKSKKYKVEKSMMKLKKSPKYYWDTEVPTEYETMMPKGKGKWGKKGKSKKVKKYWKETEAPTEYETMMPKGKGKGGMKYYEGRSKKYWKYTEVPTEYASKMPKGSKKEKSQKSMKDEEDVFTPYPEEMFTKVPKETSMKAKSKKYEYYETKVPKGKGKGGMKYYKETEVPTEYETMKSKGKGKGGMRYYKETEAPTNYETMTPKGKGKGGMKYKYYEAKSKKSSDSSSSNGNISPASLSVDMRGLWIGALSDNCDGFFRGLLAFQGQDPSLLPPQQLAGLTAQFCNNPEPLVQNIFQDCLKMTITGGDVVHTMILDGTYVTEDFHFSGAPARWVSVIEEPLQDEAADGATATVVFYSPEGTGPAEGNARRYINSDGDLVMTQDLAQDDLGGGATKGTFLFQKQDEIEGCVAYDPLDAYCSDKEYPDTSQAWTTACCEAQGGDAFLEAMLNYPRPPFYVANGYSVAPGWMPCRL